MYHKFSRTLLRMLRHSRQDCNEQLMETDGYMLVHDLLKNPTLRALGVSNDILYHVTTLCNTRGLTGVEVRADRLAIRAKWGQPTRNLRLGGIQTRLTDKNATE
eukprot:4726561-Heterocapsa_arctica.AAC.1